MRRWVDPKLSGDVPAMVEALQGVDVLTSILPNIVEISAQLPDLKLIQIQAAGYDEFTGGGPDVLEGLRQNDVMLANNGGSNAVGVAETTVMLMLAVCKNMFELALMTRQGKWTAHHSTLGVRGRHGARELSSQTVGIVGFGNIGRMVARNLQGFRCKVLYYDREELMVGRDGELDAEAVSFEELLRRSDIVTVHVPNQPSTNGMITGKKLFGKEQFDMMKESVRPISGSSPHCLHSRLLTRTCAGHLHLHLQRARHGRRGPHRRAQLRQHLWRRTRCHHPGPQHRLPAPGHGQRDRAPSHGPCRNAPRARPRLHDGQPQAAPGGHASPVCRQRPRALRRHIRRRRGGGCCAGCAALRVQSSLVVLIHLQPRLLAPAPHQLRHAEPLPHRLVLVLARRAEEATHVLGRLRCRHAQRGIQAGEARP